MAGSSVTMDDAALWRFFYRARSAEEENGFRAHYLYDDVRQITALISFVLMFMLVISIRDLIISEGTLPDGLFIRTCFMVIGAAVLWLIRYVRQPWVLDFGALFYSSVIALGLVYFHAAGGASVERMVAVITLYVYMTHLAFPTYTMFITPPVSLALAGETYLLTTPGSSIYTSESSIILIVLLSSLVMAALASALLQRSRYNAYRAMRQVKTLSGLIPICASCKKIRDDGGFYTQLEQYIREHSDAEFSHGLCPQCARVALQETSV